jgi:hypothetical protein
MKIPVPLTRTDTSKERALQKKLTGLSSRVRKKEIKTLKLQKKTRVVTDTKTGKSALVKLNIQGNLAGMSHFHSPPSSEHMRKVRSMRQFYSKQMPVLQCSNCAYATTCPQFKAGFECQFLPFLNSHKVETESDLIHYMKELIGANMRRAHLATLMETLSGGTPSPETTEALSLAFFQLEKMARLLNDTAAKGSMSVESEDTSIISKIFGSWGDLLYHTNESQAKPIEVILPAADRQRGLVDSDDSGAVNVELVKDHSKDEIEQALGIPVVSFGKKAKAV